MDEETRIKADQYLDRFISSDLTMIKINDGTVEQTVLIKALHSSIKERGLEGLNAYIFMNGLYLEKI